MRGQSAVKHSNLIKYLFPLPLLQSFPLGDEVRDIIIHHQIALRQHFQFLQVNILQLFIDLHLLPQKLKFFLELLIFFL